MLPFKMWWLPGLISHHSALTLQIYQTFIPWQTCQVLFHFSPNYFSSGEVIFFRCSSCVIFSGRLTTGRIRGSYTLYMCLWSRWPVIYVDLPCQSVGFPMAGTVLGIVASLAPSVMPGQVLHTCEKKAVLISAILITGRD